MRIISKFRDYYDIGLSYGLDPKLVYVRDTREVKREDFDFSEIIDAYGNLCSFSYQDRRVQRGAVAFCGKVYPFYCISDFHTYNRNTNTVFGQYFFSYQAFENFVKASKDFDEPDRVRYRNKWIKRETIRKRLELLTKATDDMFFGRYPSKAEFDEKFVGKRISDNIFIQTGVPIILIYSDAGNPVIFNPRLRELGFASVIDPVTAFQELAMYIGNNLAKQVDPSEDFSDDMKRDIAGFDKWSFRKKSKKKK